MPKNRNIFTFNTFVASKDSIRAVSPTDGSISTFSTLHRLGNAHMCKTGFVNSSKREPNFEWTVSKDSNFIYLSIKYYKIFLKMIKIWSKRYCTEHFVIYNSNKTFTIFYRGKLIRKAPTLRAQITSWLQDLDET